MCDPERGKFQVLRFQFPDFLSRRTEGGEDLSRRNRTESCEGKSYVDALFVCFVVEERERFSFTAFARCFEFLQH